MGYCKELPRIEYRRTRTLIGDYVTWRERNNEGMLRTMDFGNAVFDTDYFTPTSYARSRMSLA